MNRQTLVQMLSGVETPKYASLGTYTVKASDYPAKLAARFTGISSLWPELMDLNGLNRPLIVGEEIKIPRNWLKEADRRGLGSLGAASYSDDSDAFAIQERAAQPGDDNYGSGFYQSGGYGSTDGSNNAWGQPAVDSFDSTGMDPFGADSFDGSGVGGGDAAAIGGGYYPDDNNQIDPQDYMSGGDDVWSNASGGMSDSFDNADNGAFDDDDEDGADDSGDDNGDDTVDPVKPVQPKKPTYPITPVTPGGKTSAPPSTGDGKILGMSKPVAIAAGVGVIGVLLLATMKKRA